MFPDRSFQMSSGCSGGLLRWHRRSGLTRRSSRTLPPAASFSVFHPDFSSLSGAPQSATPLNFDTLGGAETNCSKWPVILVRCFVTPDLSHSRQGQSSANINHRSVSWQRQLASFHFGFGDFGIRLRIFAGRHAFHVWLRVIIGSIRSTPTPRSRHVSRPFVPAVIRLFRRASALASQIRPNQAFKPDVASSGKLLRLSSRFLVPFRRAAVGNAA